MKAGKAMDIAECYRILNLDEGADWEDIRKSFHSLAMKHHPDRNDGGRTSEEHFKKISLAYRTLEHRHQTRPFAYRVYSPVQGDSPSTAVSESVPGRWTGRWSRWSGRVLDFLRHYESKWLELNVERVVTIDPGIATRGGTIIVKNASGSFHVQVPEGTGEGAILRIPGKGETGLFQRLPGDLLLKIQLDRSPGKPRQKVECFYQVKISREQLQAGRVRTLQSHQGPIKYILPRIVKSGQTFLLKSKPHPETGESCHHILLVIHLV
ncbi:MAG: DnaJ domain-containing protein [Nitrospinaceae bacterium]|nr:DnaJ domain-containing protein [Nitrospinaceae bacterium]NIR57661.1 DnaJ domain-containing protein [Nitrospinaceae bacterium]NIS88136.1 DnaJ domain-containing protein [Nitrospinaceae bacterium]NIT85003.1 DnaJ domain-containing protein [Nitrospinaceae bacterium]NIW08725.1 DnaJ domain-containing protein [Nitrospinaceae bacterium]